MSLKKDLNNPRVVSINYTMSEINSLTDDIYDGLIDYDIKSIEVSVQRLMEILTELQASVSDGN